MAASKSASQILVVGGPPLSTQAYLISANPEFEPLVNDLVAALHTKLHGYDYRVKLDVDRYSNLAEVIEIVQSNSLFTNKNFIELRFKSKPSLEQQQQLLQLILLLDENNFLCICCDKLDKKDLAATWLTAWRSTAELVIVSGEFGEIRHWVQYRFQLSGLSCEIAAAELLIEMNQGNLVQLHQEINKLSLLFATPYQISYQDISAHVVDNVQYNIFALSAAYLRGNLVLAQRIFINLCQNTEDAILVVWSLSEDIRRLFRICGAYKANPQINFMRAIDGLRIWGDAVAGFRAAYERLSYPNLIAAFEQLALIDCSLKGLKPGAALLQLEQLIIGMCRGEILNK